MARLETTALSSFTLSSRVSSGSASRKEPHEQHRGNISPRAHRGRLACSSLCTAALQLQSRVPHRVTAPIPIGFGVDASLSLATLLPLLVVSLASTREERTAAVPGPAHPPAWEGMIPMLGLPKTQSRGCQLTFPCLGFQDAAHGGAASVVRGAARRGAEGRGPGTARCLPARGPGARGPGFASRWSIIIILQRGRRAEHQSAACDCPSKHSVSKPCHGEPRVRDPLGHPVVLVPSTGLLPVLPEQS